LFELGEANFDSLVLGGGKNAIVKFFAPWCVSLRSTSAPSRAAHARSRARARCPVVPHARTCPTLFASAHARVLCTHRQVRPL
jgi:thiol-disulfide isomerase/thioredoxin